DGGRRDRCLRRASRRPTHSGLPPGRLWEHQSGEPSGGGRASAPWSGHVLRCAAARGFHSCSIRKGRREGAACGTRNGPPARSPSSRFPAEALSNAAPRASSGSRPSEASKSSAEAPAVRRNGRECRVKAISVRQATKMMSLWPALVNTLAVLATVAVVSTGGTRWAPAAFLVPLVIILWRQRRTV